MSTIATWNSKSLFISILMVGALVGAFFLTPTPDYITLLLAAFAAMVCSLVIGLPVWWFTRLPVSVRPVFLCVTVGIVVAGGCLAWIGLRFVPGWF